MFVAPSTAIRAASVGGGGLGTVGWRSLLAALLAVVALLGAPAVALAASLSLDVRPTMFAANEVGAVRLVVEGANLRGHPDIPTSPGLTLDAAGTESSFQLSMGRVEQSVTFTYRLRASAPGTYNVGPLALVVEGKTIRAEAVEVHVVAAGTGRSSGGRGPNTSGGGGRSPSAPAMTQQSVEDALFVRAWVEPQEAYVGQSVMHHLEIGTAVREQGTRWLGQEWGPLSVEGGVEAEQSENREVRDGRTWTIHHVATPLFALTPGDHTIPAAKVVVDVVRRQGLLGIAEPVELVVEPISVRILPVPEEGRPALWSGAVGRFTVEQQVEPKQLRAGETATRTFVVSGAGAVRGAHPEAPVPDSVRAYDEQPQAQLAVAGGGLQSRTRWTQALVPMQPGRVELPAATFHWFDPTTRSFAQHQSPPVVLDVVGQAITEDRAATGPEVRGKSDVRVLGTDILPPHAWSDTPGRPRPWDWPWLVFTLLPPLAAAGAWGWSRRSQWAKSDGGRRAERRRAEKDARARARTAAAADEWESVERAVRDALSARWGQSSAHMCPADFADRLDAEHGLGGGASLRALLERAEAVRYGGGRADGLAAALHQWLEEHP